MYYCIFVQHSTLNTDWFLTHCHKMVHRSSWFMAHHSCTVRSTWYVLSLRSALSTQHWLGPFISRIATKKVGGDLRQGNRYVRTCPRPWTMIRSSNDEPITGWIASRPFLTCNDSLALSVSSSIRGKWINLTYFLYVRAWIFWQESVPVQSSRLRFVDWAVSVERWILQ